jgi:hypothetical protein
MSIKIEELQSILIEAGIPAEKRSEAIKLAQEVEAEKKAEREEGKAPKSKTKYVVLIRGDEALKVATSGGAWLVKMPDEADTSKTLDILTSAAARQNDAKGSKPSGGRGRPSKNAGPITSWVELFDRVKAKFLKTICSESHNGRVLKVVTKEAVEIQVITSEDVSFSK